MERIYIAQGATGLFKVGRTRNFVKRLRSLRKEFKRHGDRIADAHAFDEIATAYGAEQMLMRFLGTWFCRLEAGRSREWFTGVDFDIALIEGAAITRREAGAKPFVPLSAEEYERLRLKHEREREERKLARERLVAEYEARRRVPRLLRRRGERAFAAILQVLGPESEPQPEAA